MTPTSMLCTASARMKARASAGSRRLLNSRASALKRRPPSSLGELHLQADPLHALRAQLVPHLQHRLIARVLVPANEHRQLAILAARAFDEGAQLGSRDAPLADDGA